MTFSDQHIATLLGPMPPSDSAFMRRIRIHQAWYRVCRLGLSRFGVLANSGSWCGSVLHPEDARAMTNFHGEAAREAYLARRAKGWGVDPIRCTQYMTSSQTLTFNMLADLTRHPRQCAFVFNALLGRTDLARAEKVEFELSPVGTPYWLGDRTLVDAAIWFQTNSGDLQASIFHRADVCRR